ncbi:MAG: putative signal peptide protein, partial [Pseudomonadota bacterium]
TYTPNAPENAVDSFSYKVCDNSATPACSAAVTVTLNLVASSWEQKATFDFIEGPSVSISGDTSAIGAYELNQKGGVYVYRSIGQNWVQASQVPEAIITAVNSNLWDAFGYSVSLSGDTLAVGACDEDSAQTTITNDITASSDISKSSSGAVYIYRRSGTTWSQEAYIKASNSDSEDYFGVSVSLSGNVLAVGAAGEDGSQTTITNGASADLTNNTAYLSSGAVYVYRRTGTSWAQEAYIKARNNGGGDEFGTSVALSGDTLAVGAPFEDSNTTTITTTGLTSNNLGPDAGAVYVFRYGGTWAQETYVKAVNAGNGDRFGYSVALSGDTLAVGARFEDSNQTTITNGATATSDDSTTDSGAVYIYRRSVTSWAREAYVKAVNAGNGDQFGASVALSGNTLAVGAIGEDSNQTTVTNGSTASTNNELESNGAVYIYFRSGSNWAQEAYVKPDNAFGSQRFGTSLSISGDTLVVGTSLEHNAVGPAYVFRQTGRMFDPDLRVSSRTSESITFEWASNLGSTTQVKVAPAVVGTGSPAANCSDAGAITLAAGTSTYTYSGLTANTKYGFRFCAWDGTNASAGATVWQSTIP